MKISFRASMLSVLLTLITLTVAGLGYSSYRNARFAAKDLSIQILQQTSHRIDQQLRTALVIANSQGELNRLLLESGQYQVAEFPRLARYWLEVMRTHPRITRISFGLEATGDWYYVRRVPGGRLAIGTLIRNPQTDKLVLDDYWPEDFPAKPFFTNPDQSDEDPRRRPWYIAARKADKQTWSESYVFFGVQGMADMPGASCATPVHRPDGSLVGVLTSSFGLDELCDYLAKLHIGQDGFAFIVETRVDGSRRVIGHPKRELLLRTVSAPGKPQISESVPTEELADPLVRACLQQVPESVPPSAVGPQLTPFIQDGVHYLGSYSRLTYPEAPNWLICIVLPETDVLGRVEENNRETVLICLGVFFIAVLASLLLSGQIARKLEYVARQTKAIGQWRIEAQPVVHSIVAEVDELGVALEETKTGLRSFQKYVPSDLVRRIRASGQEATLGGELREVTIFFSDIADFTSISERLSPVALVEQLGEYLSAGSEQVVRTQGTVDKYIGDAIMAFWGAPEPNPQHALAACTTALRTQKVLKELRRKWEESGKPLFHARIGIHTGVAVVGNIGSDARLNYTLIGDAVNLASRLEGLNKFYGTGILMSESTYQEAKTVVARPVDWVSVKGKTQGVLVYELLGLKGEATREMEELADAHGQALARYRAEDWVEAEHLFAKVLGLRADDGPAQLLLARCRHFQAQPPAPGWDGTWHMDAK